MRLPILNNVATVALSTVVGPPVGVLIYSLGTFAFGPDVPARTDAGAAVPWFFAVLLFVLVLWPLSYVFGALPSIIASVLFCVARALMPARMMRNAIVRFALGGVLGAICGFPFVAWVLLSSRGSVVSTPTIGFVLAAAVGLVSGGLSAVLFGKPSVSAV